MSLMSKIGPERLVAVTAALIAGAAVYLMPQSILQEAVAASGLPSVLPPLEPPLGAKARIGLALVAGGTVFGMITFLLGLMGKFGQFKGRSADKAAAQEEVAAEAPRLRRRDRHPDAPPRAPLLIDREIGLPVDETLPEDEAPARLIRSGHKDDKSIVEPVEPVHGWDAPDLPTEEAIEDAEFSPVVAEVLAEEEPVDPPIVEPAPIAPAPAATRVRPSWLDASAEPSPAASGPPPALIDLVERLERALEARSAGRPVARAASPVAAPPPTSNDADAEQDGTDTRLRAALESLKRFAPQRG